MSGIDWIKGSVNVPGKIYWDSECLLWILLQKLQYIPGWKKRSCLGLSLIKAKQKRAYCFLSSPFSPTNTRKVWQGNISTENRKQTCLYRWGDISVTLFPFFVSCYQISHTWKAFQIVSWCRGLQSVSASGLFEKGVLESDPSPSPFWS